MRKKTEERGIVASGGGEVASNFKTPQELVHIKHKISLLQYKYWILMLRAYRENYEAGESNDEYTFLPMREVIDALGYQPKTREIEQDLEKIRLEPLHFNILEKDGQRAKQGNGFISGWHVSSNRIGVVFPKPLREAVENLDNKNSIFHLLNWNIFNSFSGKYEAILYKLCKDYAGVGRTKEMSLETFREYMGVGADEYTDFKRLNQWCISGPIKKINESELSDIKISPVFTRQNRRVVKIQFEVEPKRQSVLDFGDDPAFRFARIPIPLRMQKKYLSLADAEAIQLSIRRANEWAEDKEKAGQEVDYGKVYSRAITEDWGSQYKEKLEREETRARQASQKKAAAETEARQQELRAEFDADRKARGNAMMAALSKAELEAYLEKWKKQNKAAAGFAKVTSAAFKGWLRSELLQTPADEEFAEWLEQRQA